MWNDTITLDVSARLSSYIYFNLNEWLGDINAYTPTNPKNIGGGIFFLSKLGATRTLGESEIFSLRVDGTSGLLRLSMTFKPGTINSPPKIVGGKGRLVYGGSVPKPTFAPQPPLFQPWPASATEHKAPVRLAASPLRVDPRKQTPARSNQQRATTEQARPAQQSELRSEPTAVNTAHKSTGFRNLMSRKLL